MPKSYGIQFQSKRFDQTSILPDNFNAGNKFYGSDLAKFITDKLGLLDYAIVDEDWGWLITGTSNGMRIDYGISDWHDIDNAFGGKPKVAQKTDANWYIVITAYYQSRILGFIPSSKQVDCPEVIGNAVVKLLRDNGDVIIESGIE